MQYTQDELLMISGLQHYIFCPRQWALIHIEQSWQENFQTVDGALMHKKAHDSQLTESRGDLLITRGMHVFSATLGLSGQCDVLEFRRCAEGVTLHGRQGLWRPFPVEYKRGKAKASDCDRIQLCAQAMCLEEMLCCSISSGALYYGETHSRQTVDFTDDLRELVQETAKEMHTLFRCGYTPKAKPKKACNACSLKEQCLPKLAKTQRVSTYLQERMGDST